MTAALTRGLTPVRAALANGAVLLAQRTSMTPAVTLNLGFQAGSDHDPASLPGVAHLMGRVLDRGTTQRSGDRIAEELDDRGVALRVTTTRHLLTLSCSCLREDFDDVLAILVDIAGNPTFPDDQVEKRRSETVTAIRQDDDNPAVRAVDALAELLYGPGHPYGRKVKGTIEAVERIRRGDLVELHRRAVLPSTLSLAMVGDVDPDRALDRAAALLQPWTGSRPELVPVTPPPAQVGRTLRRVEMPGKAQADITYGFTAVRRLDPRFYAYWVMNNILGQFGLGGRLADNIRERQGMAYYAFSSFDASVVESPLIIRAGVDPANVDRTIDAIDLEVRTLGASGPTPVELAETQEYLAGSVPRLLETNESIASFLLNAEQFGLGLDYDRRLPGYVRAVTLEDVAAAAAEVLHPDRASVAVAGPPALDSR
jgi:zinc protease